MTIKRVNVVFPMNNFSFEVGKEGVKGIGVSYTD